MRDAARWPRTSLSACSISLGMEKLAVHTFMSGRDGQLPTLTETTAIASQQGRCWPVNMMRELCPM